MAVQRRLRCSDSHLFRECRHLAGQSPRASLLKLFPLRTIRRRQRRDLKLRMVSSNWMKRCPTMPVAPVFLREIF